MNTLQSSSMEKVSLINSRGDVVSIINYGARIVDWQINMPAGTRKIVLGYNELNDYLDDPSYHGAIVGPIANRVANGKLLLNDTLYQLDQNENKHHLHGGNRGFSDVYWAIVKTTKSTLVLETSFTDGSNGYPGNLTAKLTYELDDDGSLLISTHVTSDTVTAIAPTSHPYFNLNGVENDSCAQQLILNANYFTPMHEDGIPTGEVTSVKDGLLDFTQKKTLKHPSQEHNVTLDHNFLVNIENQAVDTTILQTELNENGVEHYHGTLFSTNNDMSLAVYSTYPAIQIYTAKYLEAPFVPYQGICLEPQFTPNAVNQPEFEFKLTTPEQPFSMAIRYQVNLL